MVRLVYHFRVRGKITDRYRNAPSVVCGARGVTLRYTYTHIHSRLSCDVLHAGLTPPRSLSDIHLKRTAFSSPHAATACMGRVHGSDRAPPHSLGPDRTPSRNYYPVPLQCYDPRHRAPHGGCTATAPWRVAAPHPAIGGVVRPPEEVFRASSHHQRAHYRPARPFAALEHFSCKTLSGSRHRGRSQGGGRRRTSAGAEVSRLGVCPRPSSRVRIVRRTRTCRCPRRLVAHDHVFMTTKL